MQCSFLQREAMLYSLLSPTVCMGREAIRGIAEEMLWYLSLSMVGSRGVVFTNIAALPYDTAWQSPPTVQPLKTQANEPRSHEKQSSHTSCWEPNARMRSRQSPLSRDLPSPNTPSSTHRKPSIQHPESHPPLVLPTLNLPGYL